MAYSRPTLSTLLTRIKGDISSRTKGSAFIFASVERALAGVLAGIAHGLHGHLDWLRNQISPLTCDIEMLLAWGALLQIARKSATASSGTATFQAVNGSIVPSGTSLKSVDGAFFATSGSATASAGAATVSIIASATGSNGNLDAGAKLTLVTPIAGVTSDGVVASPGLTGGSDVEDVEAYRGRILENFRSPPKGGGPGDYVKWAKENAGVTRAWEYSNRMGYGTVALTFVMDGRANRIPLTADVNAVQSYINARMPLDMRAAYVIAPVAQPVNLTIALSPNTTEVQDAVRAGLAGLFAEVEHQQELALSEIDEVISIAAGEVAHSITSVSSLVPGTWAILTLGTVTFTAYP